MDGSLPGSSIHGILQARILDWVAFPPPGDLPNSGIKPTPLTSPALASGFLTTRDTWEVQGTSWKMLNVSVAWTLEAAGNDMDQTVHLSKLYRAVTLRVKLGKGKERKSSDRESQSAH